MHTSITKPGPELGTTTATAGDRRQSPREPVGLPAVRRRYMPPGSAGDGRPLHRLQDPPQQGTNRNIVCVRAWTANPAITKALAPFKDQGSRDEFPFASSYESAAMTKDVNGNPKPHVTTGAACALVTADHSGTGGKDEATDWNKVSVVGKFKASDLCVRSHVPLKLNRGVGTAYRGFIQSDRLINKGPFWVSVTP